MKKSLKFLFSLVVLLACIGAPSITFASDNGYNITMKRISSTSYDNSNTDEENQEGNRKPSMPILCTITENGISASFNTDEILSYEIWDEEETICMGYFVDEKDFIWYIFNIHRDYCIKFVTSDWIYIGYIFN